MIIKRYLREKAYYSETQDEQERNRKDTRIKLKRYTNDKISH